MKMKSFKQELTNYNKQIELEIKKFFNDKIKEETDSSLKKNYELLKTFVLNGGKRLRPTIFIATYKGFGGKKNVLKNSLSVEFFHNATLIEDDVMDEDDYRRNKPTIHKLLSNEFLGKYDERKYKGLLFNKESVRNSVSNSILLSNLLYCFGAECISGFDDSKIKKCLEIYNKAFIKVNQGQLKDLEFERELVSEKEYIDMANNKTAHLIRASMEIGAVLADAEPKQIDAVINFAMNITLAFQIKDDLMDVDQNSKKGHELASDIKQGKQTLLIIKALELADKKDRKKLLRVLGNSCASNKNITKAISVLEHTGAIDYCENFAKKKIVIGKQWLKKAALNKNEEEFLLKMADFVVDRNI
ncbi:MAG: polyprenyl synthetase family protein [Nanoarchaeota archaeon]|nr:polyprenyl synthetase family protein [Nanoarchaeota archaeon]